MMNIVFNRMKRVLSLDREVFAEARDDEDALVSGAIIIIIASICISIGGLLESFLVPGIGEESDSFFGSLGFGLLDIVIFPVLVLISWPIVTGYIHIFCKLAGGKANYTGFLKTMALSYTPGIIAIIPFFGLLIYEIASLVFTYRAIRVAHEFTHYKMIGVFLISFIGLIIIVLALMAILISMFPH